MSDDTTNELPEWTHDEQQLLASASIDSPPAWSLERTLHAAGTAATIAAGVTATHATVSTVAAKATGTLSLVKWFAVVTLVGAAAAGVGFLQSIGNKDAAGSPGAARTILAPSPSALPAPVVPEPSAETQAPTAAPSDPASAPNAETVAAPRGASSRAASVPQQPDLARDIAALDWASQALRAGHPNDALAALDRYEAAVGKSGALRVEASVLRIEATARAGNRARAQMLARAFLARNPKSPYASRVRASVEPYTNDQR